MDMTQTVIATSAAAGGAARPARWAYWGCEMRTGAARGHVGHFHEAGFYGSDAEFAALIVPFVEEGVAAGEPVIIGYDNRKRRPGAVLAGRPSAVVRRRRGLYATPARPSPPTGGCLTSILAMGAGQIRIAGDVPHPGNGGRFEGGTATKRGQHRLAGLPRMGAVPVQHQYRAPEGA